MDIPDNQLGYLQILTGGSIHDSGRNAVAIGPEAYAREDGDICISSGGLPLEIYLSPSKGMITFDGIDIRQLHQQTYRLMVLYNLANQLTYDDPPAEIYFSKSKGTITIDGVNIRDLAQKIDRLRPLIPLADYARNEAVRKIQRCWRAHFARRQHAARIIQYYWHEYLYGVGRGKYFMIGARDYDNLQQKVQEPLTGQS